MKVSFVVPAYNEEKFLAACLVSIEREAASADCATEIIVVNNASTDGTREVALSFPDVRVVDEPRKGTTHARHAGFLASSGELIANIDADCILPAGWLTAVLRTFGSKEHLIALSGPLIYHDLPFSSNLLVRLYYHLAYLAYLLNRFILRIGSLIQGGNVVVRRAALEKINGYETGFVFYGDDIEMARRLRKIGPVVFTFALPIYTSGRRLKAEGLLTMGWKYPINYFWTNFFKKPFSKKYKDIRPPTNGASFRTTIDTLDRTIRRVVVYAAILFVIFIGSGAYLSLKVGKLPPTAIAAARESNSAFVRAFGPEIIKTGYKVRNMFADTDDDDYGKGKNHLPHVR